tara:strand:- start:1990 stop:2181 length:192 start_codon:yes stop_codon:yes gene_type:complete
MKQELGTEKYLLEKRARIMKFLLTEHYSVKQIARIFNIDHAGVSRILKTQSKYKGLVRKILKD